MPRIVEHVQWAYAALVPATGGNIPLAGSPMTYASDIFPYVVPENRFLAIASASLASKFGGTGRASYFILDNCFTLPDDAPHANFGARPFIVPPGTVLTARFINNETLTPDYGAGGEAQWMNMTMTGALVDAPGYTWRNCMEGVNW